MTGPQHAVTTAFVELADTLVADFDLVDFLHLLTVRCQQTLGVDAVGLLLADNRGGLNLLAASSEQAQLLELFQLQHEEGPCLDCYHTGAPLSCPDLTAETTRWPRFTAEALGAGFAAVHALPMRLRDEVLGGLNLFTTEAGPLDPTLLSVAQALADVATIGLLHERAMRTRDLIAEQLQNAINSRLAVEQAKGIVAERADISVSDAFERLHTYARSRHWKLHDLAWAVVNHYPAIADLYTDGDDT
ncbi:GAF and ANTAR domain-containing protein [Amycolatopsis sp. K13G38]|uniref:GAF and ANTAR domain-containing protein n=1 Tax=Amycolatopsis acididurans TaxID=2724524 RepID=A0ABX1J2Y1_9PSEU|nr:GAF and ANTAR domain-containing protein [Amycolatopsis acididurans]NKQ54014.1 GAF and ANTAR domain-containing protein [Amycolatopsis acididurans]